MKNRNSLIALVVGILSGGLAFYLLYQKAAEMERRTTPVPIWVASRYIPARSFLRPDMVEKKSVPEAFISPSAIHDLKDVDGLTTLVPISAGEQILSNKFGQSDETLAGVLVPGFRAYTLGVNETTGVGHLLRPGDHVDLLVKIGARDKQQITAIAFQNLQVLAVGRMTGENKNREKDSSGTLRDEGEGSGTYNHVTLAVTPTQAETLMFLEGSNALRLILRAPGDEEVVSVPQQTESQVLSEIGHFSKSASKKLEVIRGSQNSGEGR